MSDSNQDHWTRLGESAEDILNVRVEVARQQSRMADVVDAIGRVLANPVFISTLAGAHVLWVAVNLPFVPWEPWDPYPFMFLATVASVEAPFIAVLVLMHQRHDRRIAELREEVALQVILHVERKAAMALRLLDRLGDGIDVGEERENLDHLQQDLDPERLMEQIRRRLVEAEGDEGTAP